MIPLDAKRDSRVWKNSRAVLREGIYPGAPINGPPYTYVQGSKLGAEIISTVLFKEMLKRWCAVGNIASDLTGPRFEPHTSLSRDQRVTAGPPGRSLHQMPSFLS